MNKDDLYKLRDKAEKEFKSLSGVIGFGIGKETIRIYVETENDGLTLPDNYDGVEVERVVTGDVSLSA